MQAAEDANRPLLLLGSSSGSAVAAASSSVGCRRDRQQLHFACDSCGAGEQQWQQHQQQEERRRMRRQQQKATDMEAVPSDPETSEPAAAAACQVDDAGAAPASSDASSAPGGAASQRGAASPRGASAPIDAAAAPATTSPDFAAAAAPSRDSAGAAALPASSVLPVKDATEDAAPFFAPSSRAAEKSSTHREQTEETCVNGDATSVVAGDGDSEDSSGRELPCFCASFVSPYFFSPSCSSGTPPPLRQASRASSSTSSSSESSSKSGSENASSGGRSRCNSNSSGAVAGDDARSSSDSAAFTWQSGNAAAAGPATAEESVDISKSSSSSNRREGGACTAAGQSDAAQQSEDASSTAKDNSCATNSSSGLPSSTSVASSPPAALPPPRLLSSSSSDAASAVAGCGETAMDVDFSATASRCEASSPAAGVDAAAVSRAADAAAAPAAVRNGRVSEATAGATAAAARRGEGACSSLVDVGVEARIRGGGACSSIEELAALFEPLPTDDLLLESSAATAALTATTLLPASAFLQTELLAGTTMSLPLIVSFLFSLFNGDPKLGLLTPQAKYMAWRSLLFLSDLHDGKISPTEVLGEAAAFSATGATAAGAGASSSSSNGKSGRFRLPHPHFTRGVQQQLQQMQQQQQTTGGVASDRGGAAAGAAVAGAAGGFHQQQQVAAASTAGESVATSKGKRTVKHAFLSERFQPSTQDKGPAAVAGQPPGTAAAGVAADGGSATGTAGVADGRGENAQAAGAGVGGGRAAAGSSTGSSSCNASPVRATCSLSVKAARTAGASSSAGEGGQQQQQSAIPAGTKRAPPGKDDSSEGAAAAAGGSAGGSISPPSTRNTPRLHASGGAGGDSVAPGAAAQRVQGEEERPSREAPEGGTESRTVAVANSSAQQKQHAAALGEQQIVGYEENFPRFVCGSIDRRWALQQRTVTIYRDEEKCSTAAAGSSGAGGAAGGGSSCSNGSTQQQQSQQQRSKGKAKEEQEKKTSAAEVDEDSKVDAGPLELQFEEIRYSAALHMWPRKTLVPVLPEKISQGLAVQVACTAKVVERGSSSTGSGAASGGGETRVVWRDGEVTKVLQATGDVYVRMQSNHREFKSVKCSIRDFLHPRVPVTRLRERLWRLRPHVADVATDVYPGACLCVSVAGPSFSSAAAPSAAAAAGTSSANSSGTPHVASASDAGRVPASGGGSAAGGAKAGPSTAGAGGKAHAAQAAGASAAGGTTEEGGGGEGATSAQRGGAAGGEESAALAGPMAKSPSVFFVDAVVHQVFFSSEEARESRRRCLAGRCTKSSNSSSKVAADDSRRSSGSREESARGSRRSSPSMPRQDDDAQQPKEGGSSSGSSGSDSGSNPSSTRKRSDSHVVGAPLEHGEDDQVAGVAGAAEGVTEGAAAAAAGIGQGLRAGRQQRFQLRSSTQREAGGGGGKQLAQGKQQQQQGGSNSSSKPQRWRQMQPSSPWVQQTQQGKKALRQTSKEKGDEDFACVSDAEEVPPDALVHPLEGLRPDKPVVEVHVLLLGGSCGSTGITHLVEDVIRLSGRRVYKLAYDLHAHFNEKVSVIAPRSSGTPVPRSLALRSSSSSCATTTGSSSSGGSETSGASCRRAAGSSSSSEAAASRGGGGEEGRSRGAQAAVFPSAQRQAEAFIWVVPRALSHEAAFTAKGRNRGLASEYHFSHYYYSQQQQHQQQRQQLQLQQKHREQQLMQQGQKHAAGVGGGSATSSRSSSNSSELQRAGGTAAASGCAASSIPPTNSSGAAAAGAVSPASHSCSSSEGTRTDLRSGAGVQQGGVAAVGGGDGGTGKNGSRSSSGSGRGSSSRSSSGVRSTHYAGVVGPQQHIGECGAVATNSLSSTADAISAAAGGGGTSSTAAAGGAGLGLSIGTPVLPNLSRWESRTRDRAKDWVDYPPFVLCCFRFHPDTRFYHRHSQLLRYLQPELDFLALQRGVWKLKLPLLTESSFRCTASLPPPTLLSAARAAPGVYSASYGSLHVGTLLLHPSDPALPLQYAAATPGRECAPAAGVAARGPADDTSVKWQPAGGKAEEAVGEVAGATAETFTAAEAAETAGAAGASDKADAPANQQQMQRQPLQQQRRQQKQTIQGSRKISGSGAGSPVGDRSRRGSCCRGWSACCEVRINNLDEQQTAAAGGSERQQSRQIAAAATAECKEDTDLPQADGRKEEDTRGSRSPLVASSSEDAAAAFCGEDQAGAAAAKTAAAASARAAAEDGRAPEADEEERLRHLVKQLQARGHQQQQPQQCCARPRGGDPENSDTVEEQTGLLPAGRLPSVSRCNSSGSEEICGDASVVPVSVRRIPGNAAALSAAATGGPAGAASASRWDTFERLWTAAAQREVNCSAAAAAGEKVTTGAGPRGRPWTLKEARERLWRVWVEEGRRRRQQLLRDPTIARAEEAAEEEALLNSTSSSHSDRQQRAAFHTQQVQGHLQPVHEQEEAAPGDQQDAGGSGMWGRQQQPLLATAELGFRRSLRGDVEARPFEEEDEVDEETDPRLQSGPYKRRRDQFGAAVAAPAACSAPSPGLRFLHGNAPVWEGGDIEALRSSAAAAPTQHAQQRAARQDLRRGAYNSRLDDVCEAARTRGGGAAGGAATREPAATVRELFTRDPWLVPCAAGRRGDGNAQQRGRRETQGLQQKQPDVAMREGDGELWRDPALGENGAGAAAGGEGEEAGEEQQTHPEEEDTQAAAADSEAARRRSLMYDVVHFLAQRAGLGGRGWRAPEEPRQRGSEQQFQHRLQQQRNGEEAVQQSAQRLPSGEQLLRGRDPQEYPRCEGSATAALAAARQLLGLEETPATDNAEDSRSRDSTCERGSLRSPERLLLRALHRQRQQLQQQQDRRTSESVDCDATGTQRRRSAADLATVNGGSGRRTAEAADARVSVGSSGPDSVAGSAAQQGTATADRRFGHEVEHQTAGEPAFSEAPQRRQRRSAELLLQLLQQVRAKGSRSAVSSGTGDLSATAAALLRSRCMEKNNREQSVAACAGEAPTEEKVRRSSAADVSSIGCSAIEAAALPSHQTAERRDTQQQHRQLQHPPSQQRVRQQRMRHEEEADALQQQQWERGGETGLAVTAAALLLGREDRNTGLLSHFKRLVDGRGCEAAPADHAAAAGDGVEADSHMRGTAYEAPCQRQRGQRPPADSRSEILQESELHADDRDRCAAASTSVAAPTAAGVDAVSGGGVASASSRVRRAAATPQVCPQWWALRDANAERGERSRSVDEGSCSVCSSDRAEPSPGVLPQQQPPQQPNQSQQPQLLQRRCRSFTEGTMRGSSSFATFAAAPTRARKTAYLTGVEEEQACERMEERHVFTTERSGVQADERAVINVQQVRHRRQTQQQQHEHLLYQEGRGLQQIVPKEEEGDENSDVEAEAVAAGVVTHPERATAATSTVSAAATPSTATAAATPSTATAAGTPPVALAPAPAGFRHAPGVQQLHHQQHSLRHRRTCFEASASEERGAFPPGTEHSNSRTGRPVAATAAAASGEVGEQQVSKLCGASRVKREAHSFTHGSRTAAAASSGPTFPHVASPAAMTVPSATVVAAGTCGAVADASSTRTFVAGVPRAAAPQSASVSQAGAAVGSAQESHAAASTSGPLGSSRRSSRRPSCVSSLMTGENSPAAAARSSSPVISSRRDSSSRGSSSHSSWKRSSTGTGSSGAAANNGSDRKEGESASQRKVHPRSAAAAAAEQLRNLAAAADALPASVADAVQEYSCLSPPPPRRVHPPVRTPLQQPQQVTLSGQSVDSRRQQRSGGFMGRDAEEGNGEGHAVSQEEEGDVELPTRQIRRQDTVTHTAAASTASPAAVGAATSHRSRRCSYERTAADVTGRFTREKEQEESQERPVEGKAQATATSEGAATAAEERRALPATARRTAAVRAAGAGAAKGEFAVDEEAHDASRRETRAAAHAAYFEGKQANAVDQRGGAADSQSEEAASVADVETAEVFADGGITAARDAVDVTGGAGAVVAEVMGAAGAATGCDQEAVDGEGGDTSTTAGAGLKTAERRIGPACGTRRAAKSFQRDSRRHEALSSAEAAVEGNETVALPAAKLKGHTQAERRATAKGEEEMQSAGGGGAGDTPAARRRSSTEAGGHRKASTTTVYEGLRGRSAAPVTRRRSGGLQRFDAESLVPASCGAAMELRESSCRRGSSSSNRESSRDSNYYRVENSCVTRSGNTSRSRENSSGGKREKSSSGSQANSAAGTTRAGSSWYRGRAGSSCSRRRSSRSSVGSGRVDDLWEPGDCSSSSGSEGSSSRRAGVTKGGNRRRKRRSMGTCSSRSGSENHAASAAEGEDDSPVRRRRHPAVSSVAGATSAVPTSTAAASTHDGLQLRSRALVDYAAAADSKRAKESLRVPAPLVAAGGGPTRLQERPGTQHLRQGVSSAAHSAPAAAARGKEAASSSTDDSSTQTASRSAEATAGNSDTAARLSAAVRKVAAADRTAAARSPSSASAAAPPACTRSAAPASPASSCAATLGADATGGAAGGVALRSPLVGPYSMRQRTVTPLLLPAGRAKTSGAGADDCCPTGGSKKSCAAGGSRELAGVASFSEEAAGRSGAGAAAYLPAAAGATGSEVAEVHSTGDHSRRAAEKNRPGCDSGLEKHVYASSTVSTAETALQETTAVASPCVKPQPRENQMQQQQGQPRGQPVSHSSPGLHAHWRETRASAGKRHLPEHEVQPEQRGQAADEAPVAGNATAGEGEEGEEGDTSVRKGWRRASGGAAASHFRRGEGSRAAAASVVQCAAAEKVVQQQQEDEQRRRSKRMRRGGLYTAKTGTGVWGRQVLR